MSEYPNAEQRRLLHAMDVDVWSSVGRNADDADNVVPHASSDPDWPALESTVSACTKCSLHSTRNQTVFGVGDPQAHWMIVGEAPGADEDRQGEPFVGKAGQLLNEMLRAVGLSRERVYIANVLKCRPPNNRNPRTEEITECRQYLLRQITLVQPRLIIATGRIAAQSLLDDDRPVGRMRGHAHDLKVQESTFPVIVTYHPAYLLRSPGQKRKAWEDLSLARSLFEATVV